MLLAIRRRGLPFAETHMGRILQGQQLTEDDFGGLTWAKSRRNYTDAQTSHNVTSETIGDDGPTKSTLSLPFRRRLEMVDHLPEEDLRPPLKRLRGF